MRFAILCQAFYSFERERGFEIRSTHQHLLVEVQLLLASEIEQPLIQTVLSILPLTIKPDL